MKLIHLKLAAVLLLGLTSGVEADPLVSGKTIDISFTGFCDGMHLVINQNTGIVTGNATGCVSVPIAGTIGSNSNLGAGVTILETISPNAFMFVIDDQPQTFAVHDASGVQFNNGTYSV